MRGPRGATEAQDEEVSPRIPFVLAVDVEPDGHPTRPTDAIGLDGFRRSAAWLGQVRERIETATGRPANFAWFVRMDPQIAMLGGRADALATMAGPELGELIARGDGVGVHTHAARWEPASRAWEIDYADAGWVDHCVRSSFQSFVETFGTNCLQHRFGDGWTEDSALDVLAALGARVDLTVEPGIRPVSSLPRGYRAVGPRRREHDLVSTPARHADSDLWSLPLTGADPGPALPLHVRVARRLRVGRPRHRPLHLQRHWRSPAAFWDLVESTLARMPAPYVALAIRSDYALDPAKAGMASVLDELLRRPLLQRLELTDAIGAALRLGLPPGDRPTAAAARAALP